MATSRHDTSGDREALPLDEMCHNLATLYEKLFSARTKWYNIGLKFELTPDTLQAITYQYKTNPEECLRAMLNKRLETVEPLSWKEVCGCLRSPTVERNDVAEKIEEWRIGQRADVNTTSQNLATEVPPLSSLPVTGGLNNSSVKQNNQEVGLGMTSTNVTGENISSTEGTIALIKRNLNNIRMGRIQRPSEASSADLEVRKA